MKEKSQKEKILEYLKKHGSITTMQAINYFHCTRISARIAELRADGWNIETECESKNKKQRWVYRLK